MRSIKRALGVTGLLGLAPVVAGFLALGAGMRFIVGVGIGAMFEFGAIGLIVLILKLGDWAFGE